MKYMGLIVFSFVFSSLGTPLEDVRNQFPYIENLDEATNFLEKLNGENSPEEQGYVAAMILMKSRYVKGPFSKLKFFKKGKKILDATISKYPSIIEIRYIRFLMQKQIPNFLGYNRNIEEDFEVISEKLLNSNLTDNFKIKMLKTMLLVDNLSDLEKIRIDKILEKI